MRTSKISTSYGTKALTALTLALLLCSDGAQAASRVKSQGRPSSRNENFQKILKQTVNNKEVQQQKGYKEPVMIHIVPHSYNTDFIGALEEYFSEEKELLMQEHFDKVFNSVVVALNKDPTRTFTHYEVKHFSNWYKRQNRDTQDLVYKWFSYGNFEIVNGGWDMHDDSCPSYQDILVNLFKGHQFLYEEMWYFPRVAWSLDFDGHSSTNARLLADSGIEALFVRNIDPQDRQMRLDQKSMEFIWRPHYQHQGRKSELFTHVFYNFDVSPFDLDVMDPPQNFTNEFEKNKDEWDQYWKNETGWNDWWWGNDTFDVDTGGEDYDFDWWNYGNDTDVFDFNNTDIIFGGDEDYNQFTNQTANTTNSTSNSTQRMRVMHKLKIRKQFKLQQEFNKQKTSTKKMHEYALEMSQYYRTPHLLMMVGNDVNFEDAETYYHQLDQLIARFNSLHEDVQLTHSTLSFYDEVVHYHDVEHATNYFDMMAIPDTHNNYFTGMYSSRENLKGMISSASHTLSAHNKLYAAQVLNGELEWDKVNKYLNASNILTTAVAEAQDQDGVTGTSKKELADQIVEQLQKAVEFSTEVTTEIINQAARKIAGVYVDKTAKWSWCTQHNLTKQMNYKDCPISQYEKESRSVNFYMIVAVFNPATNDVGVVRVAIPHGNLTAQVYKEKTKTFETVPTQIICKNENDTDCWMYIKYALEGHQIGFVELKYDATQKQLISRPKRDMQSFKIENSKQSIQYRGEFAEYGSMLILQKKDYISFYRFGFDLRYYPTYQGFQGSRAGASVFKPTTNESLKFSNLTDIYYHQGNLLSQITFVYNSAVTNESAVVRARLFEDETMIEWDVHVHQLPESRQGQEITVNFYSLDIDNNNHFFTDSNGLQMEQRTVNYRPTWMYQATSHQNISVNYYPVNSAIAIRDKTTSTQMTVMTSKTHGGSVIKQGRIELVHSRRILFDDQYSKGVLLNERQPVQATYYMQLFNRNQEESHQRSHQIHIENPIQSYFAFFYSKNLQEAQEKSQTLLTIAQLKSVGFPVSGAAKIEYMPFNRTQIYFRIDNLEDNFDQKPGQAIVDAKDNKNLTYFNLKDFANLTYLKIHGKPINETTDYKFIAEMSLSGNQEHKWMQWEKVKWQGIDDDDIVVDYTLPREKDELLVSLEAQKLRMFYMEFFHWDGEDWGDREGEQGEEEVKPKQVEIVQ